VIITSRQLSALSIQSREYSDHVDSIAPFTPLPLCFKGFVGSWENFSGLNADY